ncbi:YihY/virulence factor BrkB family protein [Cellulomonas sp. NPDC089187]|uniref:YihY/virulence factor BrkB family protein n=1 Tax=Cellulomonas sp. NPDC089187 TaxID=3154970 RepID=UPI00342A2937
MPAAVIATGLLLSVLARRSAWVRDRLPTAATTILTWTIAGLTALALAGRSAGWGRTVVGVVVATVGGVLAVLATGWLVGRVRGPLARRRERHADDPPFSRRVIAWADRHPVQVRGRNVLALAVRSVVRAGEVRVTGLAAEMTYYALISLVPIATALGASLGYLRPLIGDAQVDELRAQVVDGLTTIFAQQLATDVLAPLVDSLLDEQRGGFAIGALVVTLYLASRVFRAAVRALDDAYRVESRRNWIAQYLLGFAFTIGALITVVTVLLLVVVGPLFGSGTELANRWGLGGFFRTAWDALRWPTVAVVTVAFLTLLYRYAPRVRVTWRRCLPGAVVGALGVLLVSSGYTLYIRLAVPNTPEVEAGSGVMVQAAAQMLGLVLAGALWIWLCSMAVLLGGVVNAEVDVARRTNSADDTAGQAAETVE